MTGEQRERYKAISDYAAIGNLRSIALIGLDGSIDWCCFPDMSAPGVFSALLDADKGGRFRVAPADGVRGTQRYLQDSNVLATRFDSPDYRFEVTDFMPIGGSIYGCEGSIAPDEIHRVCECIDGETDIDIEWSPRFDYARIPAQIERFSGYWEARGGDQRMILHGIDRAVVIDDGFGPVLRARISMKQGDRRALVTRWGSGDGRCSPDLSFEQMRSTVRIWNDWAHEGKGTRFYGWAGEWTSSLVRSELILKMLSHAHTGAIAAAPTTSLPETIGGVRNWDYRYSWIRDSSMTAQALISMGHEKEGVELLEWMERVSASESGDGLRLQIMYGLHGETELDERELRHFEGYRGSRPVNIGNGAAKQFQLEIYGELLNTAYELVRRGRPLDPSIAGFLRAVADHVTAVWRKPDYGIWEVRVEPRHFTYSKVMAWVALDRAIHLSRIFGWKQDPAEWERTRSEIRSQVLERGYDREIGSFVSSYGSCDLDAANLRIPLLEFLPFEDYRVQGTIDRTLEHLTKNGLVYRYHFDDGLPGKEGAFGLCTFWLIDALALSNRVDEARELFRKMLGRANHVGLFPEQFDADTGEFLGNFPQAFSHVGLINSALYIAYVEGKDVPEHAPIGTPGHRAWLGR